MGDEDLLRGWTSEYEVWCDSVIEVVTAAGRLRNRNLESSTEFLELCRGDEPLDAYEDGDSSEEYAKYLMTPNERDGDDGYLDPTVEL